MTACFDCGAEVSPEDRFCGNCGIALQAGGRPAAAEGEAAPSPSPDLLADERARSSSSVAAAQDEESAGANTNANASAEQYSEELQPTIIESSPGGQATAAARAHEPVEDAPSVSSLA